MLKSGRNPGKKWGVNLRELNKKRLGSYAIVGVAMILLRQGVMAAGFMREPTDSIATWGMVLAGIGFYVFHFELRRGRGLSPEGDEMLLGGPKLNGGLLVALSLFFFSLTLGKGLVIFVLFGGLLLLFTKLIRNGQRKEQVK